MRDLRSYLQSTDQGPEALIEAVDERELRTKVTRLEGRRAGHVLRSLLFLGPMLILWWPLDDAQILGFLAIPAFISAVEAVRAVRAHRDLRDARRLQAERDAGS